MNQLSVAKIFNLVILTYGLIIINLSVANAQSPENSDLFSIGNSLYEQGEFDKSADAYEQLVDDGFHDSIVHYNLGNAYYKQDKLGAAILNYLKSEELEPGDPDTKTNLSIARSHVSDASGDLGMSSLAYEIPVLNRLTTTELALSILILWYLIFCSLLIWIFYRRKFVGLASIYLTVFAVISLIIFGAIFVARIMDDNLESRAVILSDSVEVRSGPGKNYIIEFEITDGTETKVLYETAEWARIELFGKKGFQGWVPNTTFGKIQPH